MKKKIRTMIKSYLIVFSVALIVFLADRASKVMVFDFLILQDGHAPVYSFFNLILAWNYGLSFGIMNNASQNQSLIIAMISVIVFVLLLWVRRIKLHSTLIYISLVIGGGISNATDRIIQGGVLDFLDFHYKGMHYPAFNVADICICIGVFALLFLYKEAD